VSETRDTLDVEGSPEVQRLVRQVCERGELLVLRAGDEEVADLTPIIGRNGTASPSVPAVDHAKWKAVLLALAGAWSDIDADKMIEDIYRARHAGLPDEPDE